MYIITCVTVFLTFNFLEIDMATYTTKPTDKKIDVDSVLTYLNRTFQRNIASFARATRDKDGKVNEAYKLESEFAHLLDDIKRGPDCLLTHNIAKANEFLDSLNKKG